MQKNLRIIRKTLGMKQDDVILPVSALKREGHEQVLNQIESILNQSVSEINEEQ